MKNTTKLLSALAAGLVLSTGAYAQEAAPVSNLGPAVVGASQSENGLFGSLGTTGFGLAVTGAMFAMYAISANAWEDAPAVEEPVDPVDPVNHH